jgi:hypothetical protein
MGGVLRYFTGSFVVTALGLALAAALGWRDHGTIAAAGEALFICAVLGVLEVSLSFDNAVVNAKVLGDMDEVWRRRFITWGIAIAVFGMRLVFPLVIVAVVAGLGPIEAVTLAGTRPDEYARILTSAHVLVSAFGGAFLAMVGLKHFFDAEKEVHWLGLIERPLSRLGRLDMMEIGAVLGLMAAMSPFIVEHERVGFLVAGIGGLVTYILVDAVGAMLGGDEDEEGEGAKAVVRTGAAAFLYLEVLDASFSFDGVIGAFALTTNLFLIAIGLGIGAMFVRSLTILLVDRGTLTEYRYLEHGAFYAITALAVIMFVKTIVEVPEAITGLIGAAFIAAAFWSSVRYNRAEGANGDVDSPAA